MGRGVTIATVAAGDSCAFCIMLEVCYVFAIPWQKPEASGVVCTGLQYLEEMTDMCVSRPLRVLLGATLLSRRVYRC